MHATVLSFGVPKVESGHLKLGSGLIPVPVVWDMMFT